MKQNSYKKWTKEDDNLLLDQIGAKTLEEIAKKLKRSPAAVYRRLQRLNASDLSVESGSIRTYEFAEIVGVDPTTVLAWIKDKGLPAKQLLKTSEDEQPQRYHYIFPADFWKWAATHKKHIPFKRIQRHALSPEPAWLEQAITEDKKGVKHQAIWSTEQDLRLYELYYNQRLTQKQIGELMGRTRISIQKRLGVLVRSKKAAPPGQFIESEERKHA